MTYLGDKQGRVRGIFKVRMLLAIYSFGDSTLEESIHNIELMDRVRVGDGYAKDHSNDGKFDNQTKSLIVVDARLLGEAMNNPPSLVPYEGAIRFILC